jgi:hypothetical protein
MRITRSAELSRKPFSAPDRPGRFGRASDVQAFRLTEPHPQINHEPEHIKYPPLLSSKPLRLTESRFSIGKPVRLTVPCPQLARRYVLNVSTRLNKPNFKEIQYDDNPTIRSVEDLDPTPGESLDHPLGALVGFTMTEIESHDFSYFRL